MLSIRWRGCTFVLFCFIVFEPWLVKGDLSCYSGTVDILNGELSVASTKSIILQQCSPPTTQQPPGESSTVRPATPKSDSQASITAPSTASADNPTTQGDASASPEALSVTGTTSTASPPSANTPASASATAAPSPTDPTAKASPGAATEPPSATTTTPAVKATTPSATSTTPGRTRKSGSSVVGCVVTKSYQGSSRDNVTANFSCPASASPCSGIGFNGSTGADNQTQCCVGTSCNTLDSFIMREGFTYSKVDSCFVGMIDAVETPCGNSSNMCLTITDSSQVTNNTGYYCGNVTLQRCCQQDGALREGSFKPAGENITVRCCGTSNCNKPIPPSTPTPPSTNASLSTAATPSRTTLPSSAAPASSSATLSTAAPLNTDTAPPTGTPPPTATQPPTASPPATATPSSSTVVPSSTASSPFTGAPETTAVPSATAGHSNKTLVIGIVVAFVVGLLGGVIVTIVVCRRRKNAVARPGELLSFDNFHYKRMGADEVSEEVFMS